MVLSGYRVPISAAYVSQCHHQVTRSVRRGSRFPECPQCCRAVGWLRLGSLHERQTRSRQVLQPPVREPVPRVDEYTLIEAMHNNTHRAMVMSALAGSLEPPAPPC